MDWRQKAFYYVEAVSAAVTSVWVGLPWMTQTLLVFNGLDILGGYIVSLQRRDANSRSLWMGVTKKAYVWLIIGATHQMWGRSQPEVASLITGAYCMWELKSLLEKAALLGVPVPTALRRSMRVMQEKTEGGQPPNKAAQKEPEENDNAS